MKKVEKKLTKEQRFKQSMENQGFKRMSTWIHPADAKFFSFMARASRDGRLGNKP